MTTGTPPQHPFSYQDPTTVGYYCFLYVSSFIGEDSFVITSRQFGIDYCLQCAFQGLVPSFCLDTWDKIPGVNTSIRFSSARPAFPGCIPREFCASGWERGEPWTRTYLQCRTYPRLHLAGACSTLRWFRPNACVCSLQLFDRLGSRHVFRCFVCLLYPGGCAQSPAEIRSHV